MSKGPDLSFSDGTRIVLAWVIYGRIACAANASQPFAYNKIESCGHGKGLGFRSRWPSLLLDCASSAVSSVGELVASIWRSKSFELGGNLVSESSCRTSGDDFDVRVELQGCR